MLSAVGTAEKRGLADLKRLAAEVVVVQLDDVEAVRNTRSSVRF